MHIHTILVRLKNGCPEPTEEPELRLPPDLLRCEAWWQGRGKRTTWPKNQWSLVKAAVEPLLYAYIDPEYVHYDNGLLTPRGTIRSRSIELTACSFVSGTLPNISLYARFDMMFAQKFENTEQLYDWMEATSWLDWATNFRWVVDPGYEYDAAFSNEGVEFQIA